MRRLAVLLTLLTTLGAEQVKEVVKFRLKKAPTEMVRGWAVEVNTDGFRFETFGAKKRDFIPWKALVYGDAKAMRLHFGLDWAPSVKPQFVKGHRLMLKGGGHVDGLLLRKDEQDRHWVRRAGTVLPYPGDRVTKVKDVDLLETEIYDKNEIYLHRLERRPPRDAAEHRDLADYMFDIGNWEKAVEQYTAALKTRPMWEPELKARVDEIEDIRADAEAAKLLAKAKSMAFLNGDYARAEAMIRSYITKNNDAKRRGLLVLDQILERKEAKLRVRFFRVKHEEFDRTIRRYLFRNKPDLKAAMDWIDKEMAKKLKERVKQRLGIDDEGWEDLSATRIRAAPHFATYWTGSFIVSKRTKTKGKKGKDRGDPETWWAEYNHVQTRANWLKAYAAERFGKLFEVINIRSTPCDRCGGKGFVRKLNPMPQGNQPMEWNETCPRCWGIGQDRGVAYK